MAMVRQAGCHGAMMKESAAMAAARALIRERRSVLRSLSAVRRWRCMSEVHAKARWRVSVLSMSAKCHALRWQTCHEGSRAMRWPAEVRR